jgi:hypothetical protein
MIDEMMIYHRALTGNAVKHSRSRIRQNLDLCVRFPKSGDFGYGQNAVNF